MSSTRYDVIIVGGGISGSAALYEFARYTSVKKLALIEKYHDVGTLNTSARANSQTIHFGDIETNYTLDKAKITQRTASMVEKYCLKHNLQNDVIFHHQKMAMGVGDEEVAFMTQRYHEFVTLFPHLQLWDKNELKKREPAVVYTKEGKERKEPIIAMGNEGWTTVDYGKMATSLINEAKKEEKTVDTFFNTRVLDIDSLSEGGFRVQTSQGEFFADSVLVNAGAHSLFLAHRSGHGLDLACLPIAGSFYLTKKKLLNGKVYMVQNPKLPFAALHGDPDICENGLTRFGPTALVLPQLERFHGGTVSEFFTTLRFDSSVAKVFTDLLKDSDIRNYIFKNFLFEVPLLNKSLFVKDAQKIVPSLQTNDLYYAQGFGGVRPQVINKTEQKLMLGEASINPHNGAIFNMTPSPGATSCLGNAERDVRYICDFLGHTFDESRMYEELLH